MLPPELSRFLNGLGNLVSLQCSQFEKEIEFKRFFEVILFARRDNHIAKIKTERATDFETSNLNIKLAHTCRQSCIQCFFVFLNI